MPHSTLALRTRRLRGRALATLATLAALVGASTALAPAALAAPAEAGSITISAPSSVTAGDTVSVSVDASAAVDLFACDVTVTYDPALLAFDDAAGTFPDGGFDSVSEDTGSATFTNTRLGASPGLAGAQALVTFTFTSLAAGSAEIAVSSVTLVSSTSESTPLTDVATATTAVAAAPVVTPSPTPTVTPTTSPTAEPSASADPTETPAATDDTDPLAVTGSDATVWFVLGGIALVGVAAGILLIARRKAVQS
ncbi:cohesin domain-containing protein [Microbacterium sp. C7(2022)]|uniref:cohesin domain-containing protein n=1 Tax=Microbacterium sp. C7(2022) TaxID=2992759 RepID=UPI00237A1EE4|nr:cohesin domain-containing protein [Microbacterium sp. C7(2022)]MDE0545384.1 cohesin domain-containing protein [Microbacterium sp. C7(2022)]